MVGLTTGSKYLWSFISYPYYFTIYFLMCISYLKFNFIKKSREITELQGLKFNFDFKKVLAPWYIGRGWKIMYFTVKGLPSFSWETILCIAVFFQPYLIFRVYERMRSEESKNIVYIYRYSQILCRYFAKKTRIFY